MNICLIGFKIDLVLPGYLDLKSIKKDAKINEFR